MSRFAILTALIGILFLSVCSLSAADNSRLDVYGGFSILRGEGSFQPGWDAGATLHLNDLIGIKLDVSGNYGGEMASPIVFGVISYSDPTSSGGVRFPTKYHQYTALLGPQLRFKLRNGLEVFGHALLGATNRQNPGTAILGPYSILFWDNLKSLFPPNQKDTALAAVMGGGIDYRFSPRFSWRLISIDYQMDNAFQRVSNRMRLSTGLVIGFGKRK